MAERMHACRPHDEVQTGCKQRRHQQINHQHKGVRRLHCDHWQRQQQQAQRCHRDEIGLARTPQGLLLHAHVAAWGLGPPQQTPGACHQHHCHHQKLDHQRQF